MLRGVPPTRLPLPSRAQGIVYETLDMSGLVDYTVGGCIHMVVNNQVRHLPSTAPCPPAAPAD